MVTIYGLTDNGLIFYIGQSVQINTRLKTHIKESIKLLNDKDKRIQDILNNGRELNIITLQRCQQCKAIRNERMMIEKYFKDGYNLVNFNHAQSKVKINANDKEILQLMADDNDTNDISHLTGISPRTIEKIRQRIKKKIGVKSTAALLKYAYINKLVK